MKNKINKVKAIRFHNKRTCNKSFYVNITLSL